MSNLNDQTKSASADAPINVLNKPNIIINLIIYVGTYIITLQIITFLFTNPFNTLSTVCKKFFIKYMWKKCKTSQ